MTSRHLSLLFALGLLLSAGAHAADDGKAASALRALMAAEGGPAGPSPAPAPARESHVVQRSETLDMLIRRHYAGWPFKDEVFRRALADLNPSAIPNAANNLLKRGSTLVLPTADDLRRTVQQHYPKAAEVARTRVEVEDEEMNSRASANAAGPGGDKRRWVRFP